MLNENERSEAIQSEWATCIECGWVGYVGKDVNGCPSCGYIVHINIPLTKREKNEVVDQYRRCGFIVNKKFISKYSGWKFGGT